MRIKVIASKPNIGQDPIERIIGAEYTTNSYDRDTGECAVKSEHWQGQVVLNKSEFKILGDNFKSPRQKDNRRKQL